MTESQRQHRHSMMIVINGCRVQCIVESGKVYLYGPVDNYKSLAAWYRIDRRGFLVPQYGVAHELLPKVEPKLTKWLGLKATR